MENNKKEPKTFEIEMEVRDYECDIQGIVNNANYLHYAEHTRHRFIQSLGLSFAGLHEQGIDVVVARMNLQYKIPLRPDDHFLSRLQMTKEGIRYVFHHTIVRKDDAQICFRAKVDIVCLINGSLGDSDVLKQAFKDYLQ